MQLLTEFTYIILLQVCTVITLFYMIMSPDKTTVIIQNNAL